MFAPGIWWHFVMGWKRPKFITRQQTWRQAKDGEWQGHLPGHAILESRLFFSSHHYHCKTVVHTTCHPVVIVFFFSFPFPSLSPLSFPSSSLSRESGLKDWRRGVYGHFLTFKTSHKSDVKSWQLRPMSAVGIKGKTKRAHFSHHVSHSINPFLVHSTDILFLTQPFRHHDSPESSTRQKDTKETIR